ncbi:MAG TPA: caspase family protein, partial [Candidatus Kapabacteria bacterium]|nr:caspase family protein [Candidatus Kapabacteria bacterium]
MRKKNEMKKREWSIFIIAFFFVLLCFNSILDAQTRRAFLVGIDEYYSCKNPETSCRKKFSPLSGCINDIAEMAGILEAKYGFEQNNIHILPDEKATRANILTCFEKYLINEAAPGDICVFYYSGHGSQVKNSKSPEYDGWDETIVPFDSYRGVKDIRDKELKKLFSRVLDKQAQLTVIVDACHSGSISRGIPSPLRYRFLPQDECDVADPPDKEEIPAKRGVLIFTAAQDFELAYETEDENNNSHGLFTWSLLNVLRSAPIDEPAQNIMLRVNALMHSEGSPQEPNLEGSPEQRMKSLFGIKPGDRSRVTAAVINTDG